MNCYGQPGSAGAGNVAISPHGSRILGSDHFCSCGRRRVEGAAGPLGAGKDFRLKKKAGLIEEIA
jgi:hypothetical protein